MTPGARRLLKQVVPLIPGFNPVLDQTMVVIYVTVLDDANEARERLAREDLTEQERQLWENLLAGREREARECAEALGLTPASRLKIMRGLKVRRAGGRGPHHPDSAS